MIINRWNPILSLVSVIDIPPSALHIYLPLPRLATPLEAGRQKARARFTPLPVADHETRAMPTVHQNKSAERGRTE
jgi:hypothetical protein